MIEGSANFPLNQKKRKRFRVFIVLVLVSIFFLSSCATQKQYKVDDRYTVTFQDFDGKVLDSQTVLSGESAKTPLSPHRDGYVFLEWNRDYRCVTSNLTVTAQYTVVSGFTIVAGNMIASPGQTVKMPIIIANNPGVAGAKITAIYDPALELKDSESGEAFSFLEYTKPGKYRSPCSFTWDSEKGMAEGDGYILWLTFAIPIDAPSGKTYAVNCVCKKGDFYDEDLADIDFSTMNGLITVE